MKKYLYVLLAAFVAVFALLSCSEDDNTPEEYPDWQATNEKYFDDLFATAKMKQASGDPSWKVIRNWTLDENSAKHSYDHIVVHVLQSSGETVKPYSTDSVRVHYSGRLLPSLSYKLGYEFDKSYKGEFDVNTAIPTKFNVTDMVDGVTTALLNMNLGDRWEVYIPYQLGYKDEEKGSIPAYSMLKFDLYLVGIYRKGTAVPDWKAKENTFELWDEAW